MNKMWFWLTLVTGCAVSRPPEGWPSSPERETEARVQDAKPPPRRLQDLTLEQAFSMAESIHPQLRAAQAEIEAAQGRADQAALFPNPQVVARMEVAPLRGGVAGEAEYVAGLSQGFPMGGRLSAAARMEELERDRRIRELDVRRLEIRGRVEADFAAVLYMEEVVRSHAESLRLAERVVAITKARREAGDALPEDVARVELEQLRLRSEHERAVSLRKEAGLALAAALGEPALSIESVSGSLEIALRVPDLRRLLAELETHPLMESARAGLAVERARLDLALAQRIPDVNLDLFYRRVEAENANAFDAGIAVPLPVFDRNQGRIRELRAETNAAWVRTQAARIELERRAREAHLRMARAMAHAELLKGEILPRAEAVLRGAETRHAAGDVSLADILPLRREKEQFKLAYVEALREVRVAWAVWRALARTK
ncbi:MAG: TolC family protein [Planctomycetes bacterium]|nr:TolC family protein [Planctomycetota bacterium]